MLEATELQIKVHEKRKVLEIREVHVTRIINCKQENKCIKRKEIYMLNQEIAKLLNDQINKEFYSAYLYMDMANYYADQNLNGFENWFYVQMQEERDHALLFRQYLLNNSETVNLQAIAEPDQKFTNFRDPLVIALEHERFVTSSIHTIYEVAFDKKDFRTMQFLDWFIKEQGEEEMNADENINKYDLFAGDPKGLYMLDNELKARVYVPASLVL